MLTIWVQFKSGVHLTHNPSFLEFVQTAVPALLARLAPSADRARCALLSLLHSLWIHAEKQGSSNVSVQNRLLRHCAACLQSSSPTRFFVPALRPSDA